MTHRRRALGQYAPPVRLDAASTATSADGAVWVQVALEGSWKGHQSGPFVLTEEIFDQLVANLQRHPSYRKGSDGVGCADVIQWDFHHKSEGNDASIAIQGSPAQGWVQDLEKRSGEAGLELWARTRWLSLAKSYIEGDQYHWASIAIWPDAVDPVTGENVGWYMSSIALTNDPFIQGMQPLVAAERHPFRLSYDCYDAPATPQEAFERLRRCLVLPELASVPEVSAELQKLRAYAAGSMPAQPGVDLPGLIHQIRFLLQLPVLTDTEAILAEAETLLARVAADSVPLPPLQTTRETMNDTALKLLADRLGIPSDDEAVHKAVVLKLEAGNDARTKLEALLSALGTEDTESAMKSIVDLMQKAARLEEAMPELAALKESKIAAEETDAEEDVEKVMAAHRLPAATKPALLSMRKGGIALSKESLDKDFKARADARKSFLDTYPVAAAGSVHLTQAMATYPNPDGARQRSPLDTLRLGSRGQVLPSAPSNAPPQPGSDQATLLAQIKGHPGANLCQKAMSYLAAQPGGDQLSFEARHEQASMMLIGLRSA